MPSQWTWRAGPVAPGPAVIVDIDGVLSDAVRRQHFLDAPRPDWRGFFEASADDALIEEVHVLLDLLDAALEVVLLTGRPGTINPLTRTWLDRFGIRWDLLVMREGGDYAMAREFKEQAVAELRAYGFELKLAFEDDRRNAEMFREAGIPCLYVHSGYYD